MRALKLVAGVRVKTGKVMSPFGTEVVGFKVSIGGITDPAQIKRTYEDIDRIFKSNNKDFKVYEEKSKDGKFKSFTVTT